MGSVCDQPLLVCRRPCPTVPEGGGADSEEGRYDPVDSRGDDGHPATFATTVETIVLTVVREVAASIGRPSCKESGRAAGTPPPGWVEGSGRSALSAQPKLSSTNPPNGCAGEDVRVGDHLSE